MRKLLILVSLWFVSSHATAQSDTCFWFAAPDISSAYEYDDPVLFRITSYQQPCVVTIAQPGGLVPTQTINIPANSTQSVNLGKDWIECRPGNVIQNKGIRISSNNKISVYYEVNVGGPNPEIFALKGRNALGLQFYISSQYLLNNSPEYNPLPYSSFNIVATEDNTSVTINPTANIVGHLANIPFTIILHKGQTYAAIATSQEAAQHLQGSHVISTKPIAITLADDLLKGTQFGGPCADLAGDQTVPVNMLGTEYIAFKSNLNAPYDKLYITATQNGTTVLQDGVSAGSLNAGQSMQLTISAPVSYVVTSSPAYAYQLSGYGCEVGSAILPKLNCTGSSSVSVTRSTNEPFNLTLLVKNGGQGNFLVNNAAGVITASQFNVVPGTAGVWYYAKVNLPLSSFPNGIVTRVTNSSHIFQMGVLQGDVAGNSFGYFSDFNTLEAAGFTSTPTVCSGSDILLFGEMIPSASYSWAGPGGFSSNAQNPVLSNAGLVNTGNYILTVTVPGCGISKDTIPVVVKPIAYSSINPVICQGQTYAGYSLTGIYVDVLTGSNGCDSVRTINLTVKPRAFSTLNPAICEGQSYAGYTTNGTYVDTFIAANGCDSIRTINLTVNQKTFSTINLAICQGQTYNGYAVAGTYRDTLVGSNGCDSIRTLNLTVKPTTYSTISQVICEGQTYGGHGTAGTFQDVFTGSNGCDSIRTLQLSVKPRSFTSLNPIICQGQNYEGYSVSGTYTDIFPAANGCDSVRTINLLVLPTSYSTLNQSICEGQSYGGYTVAGTYTNTLVGSNGCDSIHTLHLTVNPRAYSTINQSICEGQTYAGYNMTGTYRDTLIGSSGCDSVRTINLEVKPKQFSTIDHTICEGQFYQGYSVSGTYTDVLTSSNGCDSTRTLNLIVKPRIRSFINEVICQGQSFLGYNIAGIYSDTLIASNGCDSIRTLNLTVKPRSVSNLVKTICEGQDYEGYGVAGVYTDTLTAFNGCDSIRTIRLIVEKPVQPTLGPDRGLCTGDTILLNAGIYETYLWQDGYPGNPYIVKQPGLYSITVSNQCGIFSDEVFISPITCQVYFPTAFTPNNDNKNDVFNILNAFDFEKYAISIYNRWGQKVFESRNQSRGWDGNFKGKTADAGTYVWYCEYTRAKSVKSMKGTVILIR